MRCLNDIRLVVGTRLDIQEDTDIEAMFADELMEQAAVTYVALTELVGMLAPPQIRPNGPASRPCGS